jgi:hypothetical protein
VLSCRVLRRRPGQYVCPTLNIQYNTFYIFESELEPLQSLRQPPILAPGTEHNIAHKGAVSIVLRTADRLLGVAQQRPNACRNSLLAR